MAAIPEQHLARLRAVGLVISEPFVPNHVAFPGGVIVGKPATVKGHSLPDYEVWWGPTGEKLDAPGAVVPLRRPEVVRNVARLYPRSRAR